MKGRHYYRIIKDSGKFYPEYKGWFFWDNFQDYYFDGSIDVECDSLDEAKNYIKKEIKSRQNKAVCVWESCYE